MLSLEDEEFETSDEGEEESEEEDAVMNDGERVEHKGKMSKSKAWRSWSSFEALLPPQESVQALLLQTIQKQHNFTSLRLGQRTETVQELEIPKTTFYRWRTIISDRLKSFTAEVSGFVILKWAQTLAITDLHLLSNHGISFADETDIPRESLAQLLCDQILTRMRADLKTKIMKSFHTKMVIDVAEGLVKHSSEHGDAACLARVTGVSNKFAVRVLNAVQAGDQKKLFLKERRRDSIIGSGILARFTDFISQPEQSRECPGATISVSYKKRKPKHLLTKSKPVLCKEFLALNEDISVKDSDLMRDFPR